MADGTMGTDPLEESRRALEAARARAEQDRPLLAYAAGVTRDLRAERQVNHWAARVQQAFRETRGVA